MKMMDLAYREYSSPFSLLDAVIASGRLTDWIDQFLDAHKEKIQWEHWLNKIHEQSWSDYLEESKAEEESQKRLAALASWDRSEVEATVQHSFDMMRNFTP